MSTEETNICNICTNPDCTTEHEVNKKTLAFIKKARLVHGYKYNYEKSVYVLNREKLIIICKSHGEFEQTPEGHTSGRGCQKCGNQKDTTKTTKMNVEKKITERGGKVEGKYKDKDTPLKCICVEGHTYCPIPYDVRNDEEEGFCPECVKNEKKLTEDFRNQVEKYGCKTLFDYRGHNMTVRCTCEKKHTFILNKVDLRNHKEGEKLCYLCRADEKNEVRTRFQEALKAIGAIMTGIFVSVGVPVECLCKNGHKCNPTPDNVLYKGQGICTICAQKDFETAKKNFLENIKKLGGKVEGEYKGNKIKVKCICPRRHICYPMPINIHQGQGMCAKCLTCPSCELFITRGGVLCDYCKPREESKVYQKMYREKYVKRKELKVVEFLKKNLPEENFIYNKSVGRTCTGTDLYPDVLFQRNTYNLIVEIDENKHSGSGYSCDMRRMSDVVANLGLPCIFIRYNPDSKESDEKVLLEWVVKFLSLENNEGIITEKPIWDDFGLKVLYLFY